jgi:hypothetical protein
MNFVRDLKAERTGKAVVTDVVDEGSSGVNSQVTSNHVSLLISLSGVLEAVYVGV